MNITLPMAAALLAGCVSAPAPTAWLDRLEVPASAYAPEPSTDPSFCPAFGRLCVQIAKAQQAGVPRAALRQITDPMSPPLRDLIISVIDTVYRTPAMAYDPQAFGATSLAICERHLK